MIEFRIESLRISEEGVVALPSSLASGLSLEPGDEVLASVGDGRVILHRMNPKRENRGQPRPMGHGRGDFALPDGWDAPLDRSEADDFLNGR
ncbi:MAG TPA: AbrB/MazE/SpoVT family DNA-binding domain-containing protein [Bryobacteraceae bacterium]|nr:AbrB/MazE/SpoVT family DNA-binding domain-containing protein [Bryobacteraceae bacterium]